MTSGKTRPVFLNLLQIRLPVGGMLSIIHRVTGVLLVLSIPLMIWLVQLLNAGPQGYTQAMALFNNGGFRFLIFIVVWLLIQHSLSGIRHLLLDMGFGYSLPQARGSAWTVFACSLFLALWIAVLLW